jgi:general secretion pathway protein M
METSLPEGWRGQICATALTLALLAALWLVIASPLIGWYQGGASELAQRQALLRHMQALVETLPSLQHAPATAHVAPTALLFGATDAVAAAAMQSAVQAMAISAGVELVSMETLPAEARGSYRRIGLRVSLNAPWRVLIELLSAAGQGQPQMLVDDLQLHSVEMQPRGAAALVGASFTLLAFRVMQDGSGS